MQIWVDADACPNVIKEIIFNAAGRTHVIATFVANQWIKTPPSPYIKMRIVSKGYDVADNEIVEHVCSNDIVITADIPLAAEVIAKQANVLTPRGELLGADRIKERLIMRDFNETLRAIGIQTGGPPTLSIKDRQRFANQLNQLLLKLC